MTNPNTTPLAVIAQLVGALEQMQFDGRGKCHCCHTIVECQEDCEATAALTAGREALEKPQGERPTISEERKAAEYTYSVTAFDYPENPIGSRDWTLYWAGWLARTSPNALTHTHPQASEPASNVPMTDEELAILNERGAKAWAGVNAQDLRDGSETAPSTAGERCPYCDGTGDVHTPTGEWRGECTCEAAQAMGAKGAEPTESERLLFEAWMKGHCWKVEGAWDGKQYVHESESIGIPHSGAMRTRQLWAAWRDRAALLQSTALPVGELTPEHIRNISKRYLFLYKKRFFTLGTSQINGVIGFAHAILAAARSQPVREPLTEAQWRELAALTGCEEITEFGKGEISRLLGITPKGQA